MVTCPRPPVFAQPNILVASFATQAVVASFATQARACILSDHNIFYTPRGGGNGGVMPLGLFLFRFFFGGHLPQTSGFRSAKQILVVSFATQARAFILSDRNIFYIKKYTERLILTAVKETKTQKTKYVKQKKCMKQKNCPIFRFAKQTFFRGYKSRMSKYVTGPLT